MSIGTEIDASIEYLQQQISEISQQVASLGTPQSGQPSVSSFGFTGFKKLKIACRPGANVYEVSFEGCILKSPNGDLIEHGASSFNINPISVGVNGLHAGSLSASNNGWYEIYAISDGVAPKGILVPAGAVPSLPAGYNYSEFAGYAQVFSVSPLDLSQSLQYDNTVVMQDRGAMPSTGVAAASANTPQTLNIAAFVPPKARFVSGFMGGRADRRMMMAVMTWDYNQGIASDIGRRNANGPSWGTGDGFGMTENFENLPIENQVMYWKSGDTQDSNILYLSGYRL